MIQNEYAQKYAGFILGICTGYENHGTWYLKSKRFEVLFEGDGKKSTKMFDSG